VIGSLRRNPDWLLLWYVTDTHIVFVVKTAKLVYARPTTSRFDVSCNTLMLTEFTSIVIISSCLETA